MLSRSCCRLPRERRVHEAGRAPARRVCGRGRDVGVMVVQAPRLAGLDRYRRAGARIDAVVAVVALGTWHYQPGARDRLLRLRDPFRTRLALAPLDTPRPL